MQIKRNVNPLFTILSFSFLVLGKLQHLDTFKKYPRCIRLGIKMLEMLGVSDKYQIQV